MCLDIIAIRLERDENGDMQELKLFAVVLCSTALDTSREVDQQVGVMAHMQEIQHSGTLPLHWVHILHNYTF